MIIPKIDMHVHSAQMKWTPRSDGSDFPTPDELEIMYKKLGIDKAVVLPDVSPECMTHSLTNKDAYLITKDYPDKFYWFCNIDPRTFLNTDTMDFSEIIEFYKARGAKGIGELEAPFPFDHPMMWNLFKYAEKYDMPIIFHIGDYGYGDYGVIDEIGLPRLEKTLKQFPNLIFIGHSQKFWAEISDDVTEENRNDYPTGKVTPGRVPYLMEKYPNLHCDLSAGSGGNAMMRDPEFAAQFLEKFQDRIYFGTDFCRYWEEIPEEFYLSYFLDDLVESGKISQEAYNKICRDNALKILEK